MNVIAAADGEPLIRWDWIGDHTGQLADLTVHHLKLALLPILFGLVLAIPLGVMCVRWRWLYPPTLGVANVLYGVPSLAFFMLLIPYFGIGSGGKADFTIIVPMTLFSLSVLVPNVVDGLRSVPDPVRQAATAMGFGTLRRLIQVELPIAVPVVIAGARVATVASISLVSVGMLIGNGGLGQLFIDGYARDFTTPIIVSCVLIIALALVSDGVLVAAQRLLTPWARRRTR
ncbi:ABC transporter permease subunit [Actinoallomurus vinaceus]|uniref:ABC transporter permease subunit n=1 Tax=Actinoallomurus vinaceus TaxID=1080074 RepID=A0ABP8URF5_9ACTN